MKEWLKNSKNGLRAEMRFLAQSESLDPLQPTILSLCHNNMCTVVLAPRMIIHIAATLLSL